jgi:hypothetical protein
MYRHGPFRASVTAGASHHRPPVLPSVNVAVSASEARPVSRSPALLRCPTQRRVQSSASETDTVGFFVRQVWPAAAATHPSARPAFEDEAAQAEGGLGAQPQVRVG